MSKNQSFKKFGKSSTKRTTDNTKSKKKRWEWGPEHFRQVLDEMAWDIGDMKAHGFDGTIIFIKPAFRKGRPVILTDTISYWKPIDKSLVQAVKEVLKNDTGWCEWEIFGSE